MTGPATDSRTETDAPPAKKGPWRRTVDVFRQILQIDDTPESIARGVALGVVVAREQGQLGRREGAREEERQQRRLRDEGDVQPPGLG